MDNGKFKCPKCRETKNLMIEKRPNGNIECMKCGYKGPFVHFMNAIEKPYVRSEIDCIDGKECWALTLRLATDTCYHKLKEQFNDMKIDHKSTLSPLALNLYLFRHGYSMFDFYNDEDVMLDKKATVKEVMTIFKDYKLVIRSECKHCHKHTNIHYAEKGVLYTACVNDDVFKERALQVWVRI